MINYQESFFTDDFDITEKSRIYGGKEFRIKGQSVKFLDEFDARGMGTEQGSLIKGLALWKIDKDTRTDDNVIIPAPSPYLLI